MNPVDVSFVVPVYFAAGHIEEWRTRFLEVMEGVPDRWELILVDDGSADGSWEIIARWAREDSRIRAFGLSRNFGQHAAIAAGLERARGGFIMTLDDDLQIPHDVIPAFLDALKSGSDVAAGYRKYREDPLWSRRLPSIFVNFFMHHVMHLKRKDLGCNHVAYRRWVVRAMLECRDRRRFTPEILSWTGATVCEIEVPHHSGPSRYSFWKLLRLNLDLLTQYTFWPIHVAASVFGVLLIMAAGCFGLASVVAGILPVEAVLAAGLGLLLVLAGMMAYSIERLLIEVTSRPLYVLHADRAVDTASPSDSGRP